jgi:WD40 repeat protein
MPFRKSALHLFGISTIILFTTLAASPPASCPAISPTPPCDPNEAIVARLALRSEALRVETPDATELSALLAGEAVRRLANPEGDHAFRAALSLLRHPRFTVSHGKAVNAVALSPDGTRLGTASDDGTAQVWAATGQRLDTLHYDHPVTQVMFSPDSKWMATVSWDVIGIYNVADKKEIHRLSAGAFQPLALARRDVIAVGTTNQVRILDARSGQETTHFDRKGLRAVALDADGKLLATLSSDGAQIANIDTKATISLPTQGPVAMIAFSPQGDRLATANGNGTAQLYDVKSDDVKSTHPFGHPLYAGSAVTIVAFSDNGHLLGIADKDGGVRVFGVSNECRQLSRLPTEGTITSIAFASHGSIIIAASTNHTARLFESTTGREIARLTQDGEVTNVAAADNPISIVASAGGKTATLVEITRGHNVTPLSEQQHVSFAAFSGSKVAVSDKADVRVFHSRDGGKLGEQPQSTFVVTGLRYSPDGRVLVISKQNKSNYILDLFDGSQIRRVTASQDGPDPKNPPIPAVSFSSDSTLLAVAGYDTQYPGQNQANIRVFSTSSGKEIQRTKSRPVKPQSVAMSPDNQFFALGTPKGAFIFPRGKGPSGPQFASNESITAIVFSPDRKRIALGTERGTVYVFGLNDPNDHQMYGPYEGTVIAVLFSDDSLTLASLDSNKAVHVFDVTEKKEIGRLPQSDTKAIAFRDKELITLALDEEGPFLQTHILHPQELIKLACSILTRNLSHDEWNTYVGSRDYIQLCSGKP